MNSGGFTGVLLAGGKSSRMGQDKRLLALAGETLLQRSIGLLQRAGADAVLISGECAGYVTVADVVADAGPPGALYSVLASLDRQQELDGRALLLIPVDMPLLQPATLRRLLQVEDSARCVHYEGEVFPCLIRATPSLLAHLRSLFAVSTTRGGVRSMKALFAELQAVVLPVDSAWRSEFANVNTPSEWQALQDQSNTGAS